MGKTKVLVGDKVIKLREERKLLGRFLIIQASRPELVPKLEETIGDYEMSVVPRSLYAVDGSLLIPADKSSLIHAIEDIKIQPLQPHTNVLERVPDDLGKVLIIDAMAVLQGMKKTPVMKTISDLERAFIKRIESMMVGYNEGRVIFDRYLDKSLKNLTRKKRATTSTEFEIHPEMKLTMLLKDLLSASKSKESITCLFAQGVIEYFSGSSTCKMIVVYGTKIKGHNSEEEHLHEEADTLIPHHVLASIRDTGQREVHVWSPDTDVFTLLLDLVSRGHIGAETRLKFFTGKGAKYREIDVVERVQAVRVQKCQGLIGIHNFSGADWGGKFVGISKKTWVNAYLHLDEDDPVINCFKDLGEVIIPNELVDGELPPQVNALEQLVCKVYSPKGPLALPALRWELFRSKNMEGEMLSPTRAALLPHITRVNYIAKRDKSYTENCPVLPPINQNGLVIENDMYVPVRCLNLPAPRAVIELTKCGCKSGCSGKRCGCYKNALPCTPLCKCYASDCANIFRNEMHNDE